MENISDKEVISLDFLKNLTIAMSYCTDIDEINQVVGEKIRELIPESYITITASNETRQYARISKIFGFEKTLNTIKKYLKQDPFSLKFPLTDLKLKDIQDFSSNKLIDVKDGIYAVMGAKFSKTICKAIETLLGIRKTYAMGFTQNGIIYGAVTILIHNEIDNHTKIVIESIINQAAIIIQKKIIEENLKYSESKYISIAENIKAAIYLINHEGTYMYVNNYAASLVGKTKSEMIGRSVTDVYEGVNMEDLVNEVRIVIDNNKELEREKEYFYNNRTLWLSSKMQPFYDSGTEETVALIMSIDVTNKKLIEKELFEIKKNIEKSDNVKTAFLANLSHEIRSPMTGVMGFAQLIKDTDLKEEINEYANVIYANGTDLMKIFTCLLDLAKIEAGLDKNNKKEFSLNHFLESLEKKYLNHQKVKAGLIDLKIKKNSNDIIVFTDEYKLENIFTNLLDNAFKFCDKDFIEFGYNLNENNQVEYFVKDSGIGLTIEQKDKIFKKYYYVEDPDTKRYEGAGMGLSLVKAFIDRLNGNIWVESEQGKGSTFYFILPE